MLDYPFTSISENEVAEISLKVKDVNIIPGKDKLKGELKVKIKHSWIINEVILTLTRREYVHFKHFEIKTKEDHHEDGKNATITKSHDELYKADDRFDIWRDVMGGGLFHKDKEYYDFHYKIDKYAGHPASFRFVSGDFKCAIEYYFTASVISGDHNKSLTIIVPINIQAPEQDGTAAQMSVHTDLRGCCCKDLGNFAMQLKVDDPTIYIFQTITGKYFIDNTQSKSNISAINCDVEEIITATGRKHGNGPTLNKSITNKLSTFSLKGLEMGKSREDPLNFYIPLTVRPPQDICTSRGKIISRSYILRVFPRFDQCICSGDEGLSCPLYISNDQDRISFEVAKKMNHSISHQMMNPNFPNPNISSNIMMPPVNPNQPPMISNQPGIYNPPYPNQPGFQNNAFSNPSSISNANPPQFYNVNSNPNPGMAVPNENNANLSYKNLPVNPTLNESPTGNIKPTPENSSLK